MQKKILLIEDNKDISDNIKEYLELEWYKIDIALDWEVWLDKAILHDYDLILLDLMLPKIDWLTIADKVTRKKSTPIIMLTAKNSIEDKIVWFNKWAIDYIVKPFDLRELEARIKVRLKAKVDNTILFKDIEIDLEKREFKKNWIEINISMKEFIIFEYLYKNKDKLVSRTQIIDFVWWESELFDSDWKLDVYISNLRKKLDKDIIKTVKWFWYKYFTN